MKVNELYEMKVGDLLETFCILYSPECDYNYGIGRWEGANEIFEEFDLEDEYCFSGDYLILIDYMCDGEEKILELDDLKEIMDKLGIVKKQPCPVCDSNDYHFNYGKMCMLCNDCEHEAEPREW